MNDSFIIEREEKSLNYRKISAYCLTMAFCLLAFTACSEARIPEMANEIQFSIDKVTSLTISYDDEDIEFYAGEGDTLIIKEYMTDNKSSYYAKVKESGNDIKISEGKKPFFEKGFSRRVEVYLPKNFRESLSVTSTSGVIDLSNLVLNLSDLRVDNTLGRVVMGDVEASKVFLSTTSGAVSAGAIRATTIRLESTSGEIICNELDGNVVYTSTNGSIAVQSARGSGSYHANNSGKIAVVYSEVDGDLSFYNKNDNINITLPDDLSFIFKAMTKSGAVATDFPQSLTIDKHTANGIVGKNPTVTIKAETNNGDIVVKR